MLHLALKFSEASCGECARYRIRAVIVFPARGPFTRHNQADAIIINLAKISSHKNKLTKFAGCRRSSGLFSFNHFLLKFPEGFHVDEK
jgi:hypothetical protein